MLSKVPSLRKLINELSRLPGIGPKTALRLSYHLLRQPEENINTLREALYEVKTNINLCLNCFAYTEATLCSHCEDTYRSDEIICVVENPLDIDKIENAKNFKGRYHVLHGVISPLDGISIKDLKIQPLFERIKNSELPVKEIILALDADFEGDTTVLYLAKKLNELKIKVSRIAHGIPIGGDIDYIDHRTLQIALENRVPL